MPIELITIFVVIRICPATLIIRNIEATNAIESFNSALRKVTDRKSAFPNEMAVMKILYLRTMDVVRKWTMPYPNWSLIRGKLDLLWGIEWDF